MTPGDILSTLNACLSGGQLSVSADTFGPGGIQTALNQYFANGTLVLDGVTLTQTGQGVSFTNAEGISAPLNGTTVSGNFTVDGDGVDLSLTATLPADWTFSTSWPILAGNWFDDIVTSDGVLTLVSVGTALVPVGLSLSGAFSLLGTWGDLAFLLGEDALPVGNAPISQIATVPGFNISLPLVSATLPILGDLSPSLMISCAAVTNTATPPTPSKVPVVGIGLNASIPLAGATVPLFMDLSMAGGPIPITADVSQLASVTFDDFSSFLDGVGLDSVMPSTSQFDPGSVLVPKSLAFTLLPSQKTISSVAIELASTESWTVSNSISVSQVLLQFQYQCAAKSLLVRLFGEVTYEGGGLLIGANYPDFTFTGCLAQGSTIDITALLENLASYQLSGPQLILDDLDISVTPSSGDFSLLCGLTMQGTWSVLVGNSSLTLTNLFLQLQRAPSATSGAVGATGTLDLDGDDVTFSASLALNQGFALNATVDNLDLTTLAAALSGTSTPSGLDVTFTTVSLAVNGNSGTYDLTFQASAAVNGQAVGTGYFDLRKTSSDLGVLVGLVVTEAWSPANVWPALGTVLSGLTINDMGVLVSTMPGSTTVDMPQLTQPSVPSSVVPGVTAFASLSLTGDIVGPLNLLFGDAVVFDLLLVVDETTPANSEFQATLPLPGGKNAAQFTALQLTITEGPPITVSLDMTADLTIHGESVTLDGGGSITAGAAPQISFTISVDNWDNPFGISGLTVDDFGLKVTGDDTGLTIGLQGEFDIGTSPGNWTFQIAGGLTDFEEPDYFLFELNGDNGQTLMLSAVASQFTGLDLNSVPILDQIGFKSLEFYMVADPSGVTINQVLYPAGIGIAADVVVFSWEAKFSLQVDETSGIIASGSINEPITLGDVFTLSDTTGTTGPSGSINTSAQARGGSAPYFTLDGKVSLLGVTDSISAQASGSSFDFSVDADFGGISDETLSCSLISDTDFTASASVQFNLNVTLGPLTIDGCTVVPQVNIDGPTAGIDLTVTVNSDPSLGLTLTFSWGAADFDLSFTLDLDAIESDLSNLCGAVVTWMEDNVDQVFAQFLSDATAWVNALENVFSDLASDIDNVTQTLANVFETGASDAAAFLKQLGFDFEDIVNALVSYFSIACEDAYTIVEDLYQDCAMSSAFASANPSQPQAVSLRKFQYTLTASPLGQQLLTAHYRYHDDIWHLLAPHPRLRLKLRQLAESPRGASNLPQLTSTAIVVLTTIAPKASPGLKSIIRSTLPELDRLRRLSHAQILEELRR